MTATHCASRVLTDDVRRLLAHEPAEPFFIIAFDDPARLVRRVERGAEARGEEVDVLLRGLEVRQDVRVLFRVLRRGLSAVRARRWRALRLSSDGMEDGRARRVRGRATFDRMVWERSFSSVTLFVSAS